MWSSHKTSLVWECAGDLRPNILRTGGLDVRAFKPWASQQPFWVPVKGTVSNVSSFLSNWRWLHLACRLAGAFLWMGFDEAFVALSEGGRKWGRRKRPIKVGGLQCGALSSPEMGFLHIVSPRVWLLSCSGTRNEAHKQTKTLLRGGHQ